MLYKCSFYKVWYHSKHKQNTSGERTKRLKVNRRKQIQIVKSDPLLKQILEVSDKDSKHENVVIYRRRK